MKELTKDELYLRDKIAAFYELYDITGEPTPSQIKHLTKYVKLLKADMARKQKAIHIYRPKPLKMEDLMKIAAECVWHHSEPANGIKVNSDDPYLGVFMKYKGKYGEGYEVLTQPTRSRCLRTYYIYK